MPPPTAAGALGILPLLALRRASLPVLIFLIQPLNLAALSFGPGEGAGALLGVGRVGRATLRLRLGIGPGALGLLLLGGRWGGFFDGIPAAIIVLLPAARGILFVDVPILPGIHVAARALARVGVARSSAYSSGLGPASRLRPGRRSLSGGHMLCRHRLVLTRDHGTAPLSIGTRPLPGRGGVSRIRVIG